MRHSFFRPVILFSGLLLLCLTVPLGAHAYNVKNPAISPVHFKTAPVHAPLQLIRNGELNFAIAFDHKVEKTGYDDHHAIRPAVRLLQETLENCTGKTAAVVDTNDKAAMNAHSLLILVGDSAPVRSLGIQFQKLPEQGFEIRTFARGIAIVGYDSSLLPDSLHRPLRGTLWGAYDFIERFFGCRFYYPGKLGSIWPRTDNLLIQPVNYTDSPRFLIRDQCWVEWTMSNKKRWVPFLGPNYRNGLYPDKVPFVERWRLANPSPFWASHNPRPEKFAKLYPDKLDTIFYKTPSGNHYYSPDQHVGNYFNIVDLKFADLLIDSLKKHYSAKKRPDDGWAMLSKEYIPFGQCDNEVPLPDMINNPTVIKEKLITEADLKNDSPYSDIYGRFYQYLGNRIKKEFPDKKLLLLPYSRYTFAPTDPRWVLPDNVELRVCSDHMSKIRDPKKAALMKKLIRDWSRALGERPVASLWLYNVPKNQMARAIAPMMVKDVIKLLGKDLGSIDIFFDQYGPLEWWNYCANYVHVRTTWSEDFDGMAAIDEHWELMYGPKAGPVLREFFQLVYDSYMKYFVPSQERMVLYPARVIDRMESLLTKAGRLLPPDSIEMKRYKLFAHPWPIAFDTQRNLMSYERPTHGLYQILADESVVIDGKEDAFWSKVKPIPLRDPKGSNEKAQTKVSIRLAWNKQGIYGLATMAYKPVNKGDHPVWYSDGIETFICPTLRDRNLFHFSVDSLGRQYFGTRDLYPVEKPYGKWKCQGFRSAVFDTGKGSWNIEFFMPFTAMKFPAPKPYECWRMNIVQNRMTDFKENIGSSVTMGHHHNRKMYGLIQFLGKGE